MEILIQLVTWWIQMNIYAEKQKNHAQKHIGVKELETDENLSNIFAFSLSQQRRQKNIKRSD